MSKSRRSQPTPVQTRKDTIDVDCIAAHRVRPRDVIQQDPVEELERVLSSLEENHKLPRRVLLTR